MNEVLDLRTIRKPNKRQRKFIEKWLSPNSETFGDAYKSAVEAGFSETTARTITGNARNIQWVQDVKQLFASGLDADHIYLGLQKEALGAVQPRDRIRALELMAKIKGMFIERSVSEVNVQFTNSVPRPHVDSVVVHNTPSKPKG